MALFSTPASLQPDAIRAVDRIIRTVEDADMFDIRLEGAEALQDAKLVLGNHQGPNKKRKGQGQGGMETVFAWKMVPPHVRFVMKDDLLDRTGGIGNLVRGCVFRKMQPITVHRPDPAATDKHDYAKALLEEQMRVFARVFDVINDEYFPVILYPEGTRSPDGKILPFMRKFFDAAIERYIGPCIAKGQEPKIGLLVADTLQVFPEGLGKGVPMYRRPLTMRGIRYDSAPLIERLRDAATPQQIKQLGKWFCEDVRTRMEQELSAILTQDH
jgi:1-acyl-sn-glycerol-3-phosphate acyltransferase